MGGAEEDVDGEFVVLLGVGAEEVEFDINRAGRLFAEPEPRQGRGRRAVLAEADADQTGDTFQHFAATIMHKTPQFADRNALGHPGFHVKRERGLVAGMGVMPGGGAVHEGSGCRER